MKESDPARKLPAVLKRLIAESSPRSLSELPGFAGTSPVQREFVYSFLLWDANSVLALPASERLVAGFVDLNHLRVAMPEELTLLLGERYPKAQERASRLRAALYDLYRRENTLGMQRFGALGKREMRHYLESIEGIHPLVVGRLIQNQFGGHALPIDDRLRHFLATEGALDGSLTLLQAQHWLEHHVAAADGATVAQAFAHWMDTHTPKPPRDEAVAKPKARAPKTKAAKAAKSTKSKGNSKT